MKAHAAGAASEALADLVDCAYQAAIDGEAWPAFLTRFADVLRGHNTALLVKRGPHNSDVPSATCCPIAWASGVLADRVYHFRLTPGSPQSGESTTPYRPFAHPSGW